MDLGKILVTGASGFIGSHLVEELKKTSYEAVPLTREAIKRFVSEPGIFGKKYLAVVHCAGRAHIFEKETPLSIAEFDKVNVDLTLKVARAAIEAGVKNFIFFSSLSVFGRSAGGYIEDDDEPHPDDAYGRSKYEAEKQLQKLFSRQGNTKCIIFRLPMVYGVGNKGNMRSLFKAASKGIPLPLVSAKGKRSMIFVKNLSNAVLTVLRDDGHECPRLQKYFLNDGCDLTSGELYSLLSREFSGKKGVFYFPEIFLRFAGRVGSAIEKISGMEVFLNKALISCLFDEYRFSCRAFCIDYHWRPPYTPEQGIAEMVRGYKQ